MRRWPGSKCASDRPSATGDGLVPDPTPPHGRRGSGRPDGFFADPVFAVSSEEAVFDAAFACSSEAQIVVVPRRRASAAEGPGGGRRGASPASPSPGSAGRPSPGNGLREAPAHRRVRSACAAAARRPAIKRPSPGHRTPGTPPPRSPRAAPKPPSPRAHTGRARRMPPHAAPAPPGFQDSETSRKGSLPGLRSGTKVAASSRATRQPKTKPRASVPATARTSRPENGAAGARAARAARASASGSPRSGVTSR